MNPVDLRDRIARLPSLDADGYPVDLGHAREVVTLTRIVMSQFAARRPKGTCNCCTCNAHRLMVALEVPHVPEEGA